MLELNKIKPEDLSDLKIKSFIIEEVDSLKLNMASDLAWDLLVLLEDQKDYQEVILDLEWIALSLLKEVDFKRLFQTDLKRALIWSEYDLSKQLKSYLIAKVPILLRDEFKKDLAEVMKMNEELLTEQQIKSSADKMVKPTILNWLKEYDLMAGAGKVDNLVKTQFLYKNENTKNLIDKERDILVKLIDFYELLKITSEEPEGLENTILFRDKAGFVEISHGEMTELTVEPVLEAEKSRSQSDRGSSTLSKVKSGEDIKEKILKKKIESKVNKTVVEKEPEKMMYTPTFEEASLHMKRAVEKPVPIVVPEPIIAPVKKRPAFVKRSQMTGSIKKAEVMDPIDELTKMSLKEFRAIGAAKVESRIALLEEESIDKKAAGIKAWKGSPVNRLYIDLGRQSIEQGQGIKEVIEQLSKTDKQVLSYEEFKILADLNRKLRF